MDYRLDTRVLHLAGALLAQGSGVFSGDDAETLLDAAKADKRITVEELAALLVVYAAVKPIADDRAREMFEEVAVAGSKWNPELGPWLAEHFSDRILFAAVLLLAGRGTGRLSGDDVGLLCQGVLDQPSDVSDTYEARVRALLAAAEFFRGRTTPDAQTMLDDVSAGLRAKGLTIGSDSAGAPTSVKATLADSKQCGLCAGSGYVTCGACGGRGYHSYSRTRTRYDGSTEYYTENIPCSCSGGRNTCMRCGGSGRVLGS